MTPNTPTKYTIIQKHNPSTGGLLYEVCPDSPLDIDTKLDAAGRAQGLWANTPLAERIATLKQIEARIRNNAEELANLITLEVGKPLSDSIQTDILTALRGIQHACSRGGTLFKTQYRQSLSSLMLGRLYKQEMVPHGVVGIVSPWNYPIGTPTPAIAAALVAGNAVAFKPSEKTPKCGERLVEIMQDVLEERGHSPEVIQLFQGGGDVGAAIVQAPQTRFIFFTGSVKTGRAIQADCAKKGILCSLELGGSDAMILLPSAERYSLDAVVANALWGRFTNAGQTCAAIKRLYVPTAIYPIVIEMLSAKLSQLYVGDPKNVSTHMGPLIDKGQRDQVQAQLQDALDKGAEAIYGRLDADLPDTGCYMAPTLLTHVPKDARVLTEEVFGPVLPVIPYDDLSDLITTINELPYGLGASIFGKPKQAEWVGKQLRVANVAINDIHMTFYAMTQLGWRGFKDSGPGTRMADDGLMQFVNIQTLGKAALFSFSPLFRKAPWLFGKGGSPLYKVMPLIDTMGSGKWYKLFDPKMLKYGWNNRGGTKL